MLNHFVDIVSIKVGGQAYSSQNCVQLKQNLACML